METKELAKTVAFGAARIAGRVVLWGVGGAVLGGLEFAALQQGGWLAHGKEHLTWPVLISVGLINVVGAALALGALGGLRGLGHFVVTVGVDQGLVAAVTGRVLQSTFRKLGLDGAGALGRRLEKLPLAQWEAALKEAVTLDEAAAAQSGFFRRTLSSFVARGIERALLSAFRNEGTSGVSMERVEAFAQERINALFEQAVQGWVRTQSAVLLAAWGGVVALGPVVCQLLRGGAPRPDQGPMAWWVIAVLIIPLGFFMSAVAGLRRRVAETGGTPRKIGG